MPYKLDGNCVIRSDTGEQLKCYDNHADALAYLRALEANVQDAKNRKAFQGMLSQAETNYVPYSATKGKACANCRWFMNDGCFIVASWGAENPEPIIATGYCDRWEVTPEPPTDPIEELAEVLTEALSENAEAIISALPTPYVDDMSKARNKTFGQRLKALLDDLRPKPSLAKQARQPFSIFKDAAGIPHWHAIYTNNFIDREDEILTEKAHDNFIDRLDMGLVPMPTLQAWHTPGSDHGLATCIWRDGHMVHAVGDFMDNDLAKAAIPYYEKYAHKLKMSHMFEAPMSAFDGKHYEDYNTIEITTLPPEAAANPYTSFEELLSMKDRSPEKSRYLEALFGKDNLAKIDAASEDINKGLEEQRIAFKDFTTVNAPDAPHSITLDEKGLAEAYADLVLTVAEVVKNVKALSNMVVSKDNEHKAGVAAAVKKFDDETAAWQTVIDDLAKQVNLPPARAAHDPSTTVKPDEKLKAQDLDANLNGGDPLASWLGVKVKPVGVTS